MVVCISSLEIHILSLIAGVTLPFQSYTREQKQAQV
jgi:hypothetical protein